MFRDCARSIRLEACTRKPLLEDAACDARLIARERLRVNRRPFLPALFGMLVLLGCDMSAEKTADRPPAKQAGIDETGMEGTGMKGTEVQTSSNPSRALEVATLGAGCFWCVEAVFQQLAGVESIESGYSGGHVENPTYREVCEGDTGHAEVCRIQFDPQRIRFEELLEVFWQTHDPTTVNRQGADEGPQYRSVIFYHNDQQRKLAEEYKKKLDEAKVFDDPIVTEISPLTNYFKAEDYHQNYYRLNPNQGYCRLVIQPKVEKFREVFARKLESSK